MLNKKIKKLLIGTNNKGKLKEIRNLLPKNIKTYSTSDFKLNSPRENGKTFQQNSLIKSKYFSKKSNLFCIADDSGLEIDILKKKPGIYSARWGGKNSDFKKAFKRVYRELDKKNKNWKNKKIKARFICALSISYLDKKIVSVLGSVEGCISPKPKGKNGFGYDPVFVPSNFNKTLAQLSPTLKNSLSHRKKALVKLLSHSLFKNLSFNNIL